MPVVASVGSKPCSSLTLAAAASSSTTTIPDSRSSRYTVFEGKKHGLPSLLVGVTEREKGREPRKTTARPKPQGFVVSLSANIFVYLSATMIYR